MMATETMSLTERARELGGNSADAYWDEYKANPADDGPEVVGDGRRVDAGRGLVVAHQPFGRALDASADQVVERLRRLARAATEGHELRLRFPAEEFGAGDRLAEDQGRVRAQLVRGQAAPGGHVADDLFGGVGVPRPRRADGRFMSGHL